MPALRRGIRVRGLRVSVAWRSGIQRSLGFIVVLSLGAVLGMLLRGQGVPSTEGPPSSQASPGDAAPGEPATNEWTPGDGLRMVTISVGYEHACGIWDDGTVECWGNDSWGQATPPRGLQFREVASGRADTCGVTLDGRTRCWGFLADRMRLETAEWPQIRADSLRVDRSLHCGLDVAGGVICWGGGPTPNRVFGSGFTSFDVGIGGAICGIDSDGRLQCDGGAPEPLLPPSDKMFTQISIGDTFACGVTIDRRLHCFGDGAPSETPEEADFTSVDVGASSACALRENGEVRCWGTGRIRPVTVRLTHVSVGDSHACGVTIYGRPLCWASDARGQLGPYRRQ